MSHESSAENERHGAAADITVEAIIAAERQRCIDRVLTFAALRDQAAINLDRAATGSGPEKRSSAGARANASRGSARHRPFFGRGDEGLSCQFTKGTALRHGQ